MTGNLDHAALVRDLRSQLNAPRVPSAAPGASAPKVLTCTINRGAGQLQLKMSLDEGRINEKAVLECLQNGVLYEPDVSHILGKVLREGDVVIDVGANIGFFTVLASLLVGPAGRVVAFEPEADNLARLRANLAHNVCKNVTVIEKAVTN
jgi:hypothetical protein